MAAFPKITVVTPSFNQGRFLRETIESVLNQNHTNLEYFIVDGGSSDGSIDIIREYEDRIDWWVSEKDGGQTDAICKGFKRATGDLIGWLNSDDVYFPGALNSISKAYIRNPNASLYSGGIAIGERGDGGIRKCSVPTRPLRIFSSLGILGFGQQGTFFRREDYIRTGDLSRELYIRMDGDIMYRLVKCNPSTVVTDEMVGFFRWHETSKSTVSEDRYFQERDEFIRSLGLSKRGFTIRTFYFRLYRLIMGSYVKSWRATQKLRGKRMSDIWQSKDVLS